MGELEQQEPGQNHTSVCAPIGANMCRIYCVEGNGPCWYWSSIRSPLLMDEA
jgi:hypothetical protein